MSNDEWNAWVKSHTTMFGMNAEDVAMVASWRGSLNDYAITELREASAELLKAAPTFRNEHVSGFFKILDRKRSLKVKAFASQRDDEYTGARCVKCQNLGYVVVPHFDCVRDGEFLPGPAGYKATMAVACSCFIGSRKLQSFDKADRRPWSLHQYEMQVTTGWREMLEEKAAEDESRTKVRAAAQRADKKGPMKKKAAL